jgi:hypothetical protein
MIKVSAIVKQLQQQRNGIATQENQIDRAIMTLSRLHTWKGQSKRRLSTAARERIAAAQRARWAKWKRKKKKTS